MKGLLFTDSLSLPRTSPAVCEHDNTWPELMRKEGVEICLSASGGGTIRTLHKQTFYFKESTYFDVVIIQCGIVDCAPRFAKQWELKVLQSIPVAGKFFLRLLNRSWVRKIRNISYTKPTQFEHYLNAFESSFNCPVWFIPIIPASTAYEHELPGIQARIARYNALIMKHKHIDLSDFPAEGIMSDHHHLNAIGHAHIAGKIIDKIRHELP
jgi:hypothetical protein